MATPLDAAQVEKQQAESEGYQQGPQPEINNPNANTQFNLGNPQVQTPVPPPYYPGATETPNLQLALTNMPVNIAENMVLIDTLVGSLVPVVPIVQAKLDVLNTTVGHSVSITATATTMFTISIFLESEGDGLVTDTVVGTLTFQEDNPLDTHVITCTLHGGVGVENIVLETYPVLCEAGTVISFSTAFGAGVMTYDMSVRIVQMP